MVEKIKSGTVLAPAHYQGLTADTKPIAGVDAGDTFWELDGKTAWVYSGNENPATSNGWWGV